MKNTNLYKVTFTSTKVEGIFRRVIIAVTSIKAEEIAKNTIAELKEIIHIETF